MTTVWVDGHFTEPQSFSATYVAYSRARRQCASRLWHDLRTR